MVDYPGRAISTELFEIATQKIDAMPRVQTTANIINLPPFLRLCNVFGKFVPSLTYPAAPLNAKLRNKQPPILNAQQKRAEDFGLTKECVELTASLQTT